MTASPSSRRRDSGNVRAAGIDGETRRRIIAAVKTAHWRYCKAGNLRIGADYSDMIARPEALAAFLAACREDPRPLADLAVDGKGNPVCEVDVELSCGVTPADVRRLLMVTCAKRRFDDANMDEWLHALRPYLAFEHQLGMLDALFGLSLAQIEALGPDIVALRDSRAVAVLGGCSVDVIERARAAAGRRFFAVLARHPRAVPGLSRFTAAEITALSNAFGNRLWDLLARDGEFLDEARRSGVETLAALGDDALLVCGGVLRVLGHLDGPLRAPFLHGCIEGLGDSAGWLLSKPAFADGPLGESVFALKAGCSDGEALRRHAHNYWREEAQAAQKRVIAIEARRALAEGDAAQHRVDAVLSLDAPPPGSADARARHAQRGVDALMER